jgi:hypothetical protein
VSPWIFHIGLGNPGEHSPPLGEHLFARLSKSANTSMDTPESPTSGEMLCTIFLYASFSSAHSPGDRMRGAFESLNLQFFCDHVMHLKKPSFLLE